jgi:hypothetical protein
MLLVLLNACSTAHRSLIVSSNHEFHTLLRCHDNRTASFCGAYDVVPSDQVTYFICHKTLVAAPLHLAPPTPLVALPLRLESARRRCIREQ